MNVINKHLTFGHVRLEEYITKDTPETISYMCGIILLIFLRLVFLIPAFLVEEDLRTLSVKEMKQSEYVEERTILALNPHEKQNFMRQHKIIAE